MLRERVKLPAEKAAIVAEVSLLQESGSLAQERLRLEHQVRLFKLRTEIAKTEAKENVYEEFKAVEEEIPNHPRKFTPLPHVEPREVFDSGSKPLNPDAKPWRPDYRVVDQQSSGVCGARGQQSTSPGAKTRENQICTTHSTEKVSQRIIVDQYLLLNVRYYVVSDCGITHEIQSRIYNHPTNNTKTRLNSYLLCKTTVL